jgi:hypothetical protein
MSNLSPTGNHLADGTHTIRDYPKVELTQQMIFAAKAMVDRVRVKRTVASKIDTLAGILGEFAFAQYVFGDWTKNRVGSNKGHTDFTNIEIKTSAFPLRENLNLLVREDYAQKRKPAFYIQVIIDVQSPHADDIKPGTVAYICGFATAKEVDEAPKKDFGSKFGRRAGYRCHYVPLPLLHAMDEFEQTYTDFVKGKNAAGGN